MASLYNSADSCVDEMLAGLVHAHPGLRHDVDKRVVWHDEDRNTVAVVSGGGSGHEPFAAGYVGRGMLTAAVAGSVFASPPSVSITSALRRVGPRDVLVVVPNYTGDCLNFGLAVERARSSGLRVRSVVVGEDCALVAQAQESRAGRRGLCGLVFVFKVVGHMSARGSSLELLEQEAVLLTRSMATLGIGLSACRLPGADTPLFTLPADTAELGVGVHGEAGCEALQVSGTRAAVKHMLRILCSHVALRDGDHACVAVNNLGGSSQMELWVFTQEVAVQLAQRGVQVLRTYVGPLMTSLDMRGFQVCILKVPPEKRRDWLECLDAETDAPGWPGGRYSCRDPGPEMAPILEDNCVLEETPALVLSEAEAEGSVIGRCLSTAARQLLVNQSRLNQLDSGCGDGDTGSTLSRLAQAVLQQLPALAGSTPAALLRRLAALAETTMGGTSGALYSLMLTTAAAAMTPAADWAHAAREGLTGLMKYSQARVGDRTMLDALVPACAELSLEPRGLAALTRAVAAAQRGCDSTSNMVARAGRASYVGAAHITDVDAGAFAVVVWLEAILSVLQSTCTC